MVRRLKSSDAKTTIKHHNCLLDSGTRFGNQRDKQVFDIDSMTEEDFLKYNYQELADIATGRNAVKKDWLREFLKTCESTIEARRLSQLLTR